jgi:hypothetical protein
MDDRLKSITEIKTWLKSKDNIEPINIGCEFIKNPRLFFESHIELIEFNIDRDKFVKPYFDRLIKAYERIKLL